MTSTINRNRIKYRNKGNIIRRPKLLFMEMEKKIIEDL